MGAAIARHDAILRAAVEDNGGTVFKTVGDAVCAAFPAPLGALVPVGCSRTMTESPGLLYNVYITGPRGEP